MKSSSTERGLSEVLGAILIFALVFALLIIVQVFAVPAANAQIEFKHSEDLGAEYGQFAESLDRVSTFGTAETVSIDAGVRYPSRLFLINPPPSSYTFQSVDGPNIGVSNVRALDAEAADYLDGDLSFSTVSFTHTPNYNLYENAPSYRIENGYVYKQFPNGATSFVSTPDVINGRRISLVALEGDFSEGGSDTLDLSVAPISSASRTVSVQAQGGNPTISLYTELSEDTWNEALADEDNVRSITCTTGVATDQPCNGVLDIELKSGVTYDLTLSEVAIGKTDTVEGPAYVTKVGQTKPEINPDGTQFTVEVRDRFNNPVSGEEVTFYLVSPSAPGAGSLSTTTAVTDENGRASTVYTPTGNDTVTINAGLDTGGDNKVTVADDGKENVVSWDGLPVSTGQLQPAPEFDINSAEPGAVLLNYAALTPSGCNNNGCDAVANFENTHSSKDRTVDRMRINYYSPNSIARGGGAFPGVPDSVVVTGPDGSATIGVQSSFQTVNVMSLSPGEVRDLTFDFKRGGNDFDFYEGDFFILTMVYTDGTSSIYFVAPTTGNVGPTASFTATPTTLDAGGVVTFDPSASRDPDGSIAEYQWDFGDGTTVTRASDVDQLHTYSTAGTYTAKLTVVDDDGASSGEVTETITVNAVGDVTPAVSIDATKENTGQNHVDVDWSASDSDGDLSSVTLELLDSSNTVVDTVTDSTISGSSASGTDVRLQAPSDGDYTVRVAVTDAVGHTGEDTASVSL